MPIVDDYLRIGHNLSPDEILQEARHKIIQNASADSRNFTALEAYLNSLFYGNGLQASTIARLQNLMVNYYEDKFQTQFDNFDFENFILSNSGAAEGKIGLSERVQFSHSKQIAWNTVWKRLLEAQYQLEQLSAIKNPNEQIMNTMNNLQQLVSTADHLLADYPFSILDNGQKVFKVNDKNQNLIATLDELYQKVVFVKSFPLSNQDMGELFEKLLTIFGSGIDVNQLADAELYDLFIKPTQGQMPVNRGGWLQLKGVEATSVQKYPINSKTHKISGKSKTYYEIIGENGSKITVGNEFSDKLGKMDVTFTMPDTNEHFRVSAKNWKMLDNRDFGNTSLEAALMRTGGFVNTVAYGLVVGFGSSPLENAHNYAKACAFIDIIMGYSQETAYADTVIINDRQESRIRVYSIYDLLNKFNYNGVIGYPETSLRDIIRTKFNVTEAIGPQGYENKILSTLKQFKLSISSSVLK